jgi:tetratricopeptide (TPR) repeat protein
MFNQIYSCLLKQPNLCDKSKIQIYEIILPNTLSQFDIKVKDDILTKLISLYPEDVNLYILLAETHKSVNDIDKAILWHKICFKLFPTNLLNITQLFDIYLNKEITKNVFEINEKDLTIFTHDINFLSVYVRCKLKELNYKNCVDYLLKIIKNFSTEKCITIYQKRIKWSNYHEIGYLYSELGEPEKAILYSKKALELAIKFNLR